VISGKGDANGVVVQQGNGSRRRVAHGDAEPVAPGDLHGVDQRVRVERGVHLVRVGGDDALADRQIEPGQRDGRDEGVGDRQPRDWRGAGVHDLERVRDEIAIERRRPVGRLDHVKAAAGDDYLGGGRVGDDGRIGRVSRVEDLGGHGGRVGCRIAVSGGQDAADGRADAGARYERQRRRGRRRAGRSRGGQGAPRIEAAGDIPAEERIDDREGGDVLRAGVGDGQRVGDLGADSRQGRRSGLGQADAGRHDVHRGCCRVGQGERAGSDGGDRHRAGEGIAVQTGDGVRVRPDGGLAGVERCRAEGDRAAGLRAGRLDVVERAQAGIADGDGVGDRVADGRA